MSAKVWKSVLWMIFDISFTLIGTMCWMRCCSRSDVATDVCIPAVLPTAFLAALT